MFARMVKDKDVSTPFKDVPFQMYSEDGVRMIKVVNVCDLLDYFYGDAWFKQGGPDYQTTSKAVAEWCNDNDSHYYAADREDFFEFIAVREAIESKKDCVVVEDLS